MIPHLRGHLAGKVNWLLIAGSNIQSRHIPARSIGRLCKQSVPATCDGFLERLASAEKLFVEYAHEAQGRLGANGELHSDHRAGNSAQRRGYPSQKTA